MGSYHFAVVVEKDEHGYFAYCPELQGCYTQGETFEEVMENIKDAIRLHVKDRLDNNEPIPTSEVVSLSTLEVAV
ncbi:MAG: type II toxin-antitoxin system HicB family antitoxin [Chloroflexi bacterium]|nr:type II toxin-antitoxin system HicB family antitoxin [Chloroflexota bacterium]